MFPFRNINCKVRKSVLKQICRCTAKTCKPETIRVENCLPLCEVYEDYPNNTIQIAEFVKGKNVVMFGVNGAFAPGCTKTHLKSDLEAASTMKKNGVDEIICISVNDAYAMGAWAKNQKTKEKIRMFADPTGYFTYSLGLGMNLKLLGGYRAKRFSMMIVNCIVKEMHVEEDGVSFACTLADNLFYQSHIKPKGLKS